MDPRLPPSRRTAHWLVPVALACSVPLSAATADLDSVRRALGDESEAWTPATPALVNQAQLVDAVARRATLRLGQGAADWKPTHPLWPNVYARVRADLESEGPTLSTDLAAAAQGGFSRLVGAVAAEVSPSDIEAILAYYRTAEGQRYATLLLRLDSLTARAYAPPPGYDPKAPSAPLPDDQQRALLEMMTLSRPMQAAIAAQQLGAAMHADTSGFPAVGFVMALSLRLHQSEAAALYAQYAADIPAFTEFEKTAAAQSLFRALGRAVFLSKQPPLNSLDEVVKRAEQRHGKDWQDFYRTETGRSRTTE
jgi:hypothetical protein